MKSKALEKELELNFPVSPYTDYTDSTSVIAMENLNCLGFTESAGKQGLDLDYCRAALTQLANYHAATRALFSSYPGGARSRSKVPLLLSLESCSVKTQYASEVSSTQLSHFRHP